MARDENLPPYCIASNLSLVEMVNRGVSTKEELLEIRGFGTGRVEKYGGGLLDALDI